VFTKANVESMGGALSVVRIGDPTVRDASMLNTDRRERVHEAPHALPDGRHFTFIAVDEQGGSAAYVGALGTNERTALAFGSNTEYVEPGWLVGMRGPALVAQVFDASHLSAGSRVIPLAGRIARSTGVGARYRFSTSRNGVLAFSEGGPSTSRLEWVGRDGRSLSILADAADYSNPALSPDEKRLAVSIRNPSGTRDLWIIDLTRGARSRLTFDPADDLDPVWDLDSRTVYFTSDRSGVRSLYRVDVLGLGQEQRVAAEPFSMNAESLSPDGRALLFNAAGRGLWMWNLATQRSTPLVQSPSSDFEGTVSPDGHWLAYTSNVTGRSEVYVTSFPKPGRRWQTSNAGGAQAQWRADGRELFYVENDAHIMAVVVRTAADRFDADLPHQLFQRRLPPPFRNRFVVTRDGQRFLVNMTVETVQNPPLTVVVNWPASANDGDRH
jgi:dipeptidyl aminopeptidase/acylaminoacyl peptidase